MTCIRRFPTDVAQARTCFVGRGTTTVLRAAALALLSGAILDSEAGATPILVTGAAEFLDVRSANSVRLGTGSFITLRANAVPDATAGTTASASTIDLTSGAIVTRGLLFTGNTAIPNQFARSIPYDPDLTGPWTLTFVNGTDSTVVTTPDIIGVTAPPFAASVTISGSSSNPTFSWTYPPGSVDFVSVLIRDKSRLNAAGFFDVVFATSLPGTANTFTVPDTLAGGLELTLDNPYSIEFTGSKRAASSSRTEAVSRSFFDFVPLPAGAPLVNLPLVDEAGAYHFDLTVSGAGETVFIDPLVAIGYEYAIGLGNPNFASVLLPNVGDGLYDLFTCAGEILGTALADTVFNFAPGGLGCFTVRGIEISAGLDPGNTTAFITGLTFTGAGSFTGTMTPITVDVAVPEPTSILLVGIGVVSYFRRRRKDQVRYRAETS